jgi:hypothetical protein
MSRQTERRKKAERRKRQLQKAARALRQASSSVVPPPPPPPPNGDGEPPKPSRFPKLGLGDLLALVALPLAVAGVLIDNVWGVGICLVLATIIPCVAIARHTEVTVVYRGVLCLFVTATFATIFIVWYGERDKRELAKNEGILYPAELPRPKNPCSIPEGDFAIFAGGGAMSSSGPPTSLLTIGGQEIISAEQDENGRLILRTLRVFDEQGNIIARIDKNGFWLHPLSRRLRPDWSTIVIYDGRDNEALNIRFINKNTILIKGIFKTLGRVPMIITENSIRVGGNTLYGPCVSGAGRGFVLN